MTEYKTGKRDLENKKTKQKQKASPGPCRLTFVPGKFLNYREEEGVNFMCISAAGCKELDVCIRVNFISVTKANGGNEQQHHHLLDRIVTATP